MFKLLRRARPAGPRPARRPRLGFDVLESRDCPSAWDVPPPEGFAPPAGSAPPEEGYGGGAVDSAPEIVDFDAEALGGGMYCFTGRVEDESPGGLTVTFSGGPTINGARVTTNADGTFSLTIQLYPADVGMVSVVTHDSAGHESNRPGVPVNP